MQPSLPSKQPFNPGPKCQSLGQMWAYIGSRVAYFGWRYIPEGFITRQFLETLEQSCRVGNSRSCVQKGYLSLTIDPVRKT